MEYMSAYMTLTTVVVLLGYSFTSGETSWQLVNHRRNLKATLAGAVCSGLRSKKTSARRRRNNMSLFIFALACLSSQFVVAWLAIIHGIDGWVFFMTMALSAHLVIEVADKTSYERTDGFKLFVLTYYVGEVYLFVLAFSAALTALFPIYSALYDFGKSLMLTLSLLSLLSVTIEPLLNMIGAGNGVVSRIIHRAYVFCMRLPFHGKRG